jgi:hypothetical protein
MSIARVLLALAQAPHPDVRRRGFITLFGGACNLQHE